MTAHIKSVFGRAGRLLAVPLLSAALSLPAGDAAAQNIDSKVTNFTLSQTSIKFDVQLKAGTGYVLGSPTAGDWTGFQISWDFYIEPGVTVNMPGTTMAPNAVAQAANLISTAAPVFSFPGAQSAGSTSGLKVKASVTRVSGVPAAINDLPAVYTTYFSVTIPVVSGTPTTASRIYQRTTTTSASGGSYWGNSAPTALNFLPFTTNAPGSGGGGAPLPVELLDFSARRASDGQRVQLDWVTATETGCDHFEVERSATEGGVYSGIGVTVKGQGTSSAEHSYQSYDRMPLVGMNWYRLKVVDLSGKVGYSKSQGVRFDGAAQGESVSLYPNPLTRVNAGAVHLQVSASSDQSVSYTISDGGGRLVGGGSVEVSKGSGAYGIEGLESLAAGTYYLSAKGATINANLKFNKAE